MRVQKLGGFDAIADNRVWKNLFEDLSEPGKCITQGMTKRKYERILLPFERYERDLRENGKYSKSELTISTISKNNLRRDPHTNRMQLKRHRSTSPAIEIIPLKNGAAENVELTLEQISEIKNIIKPKDYECQQYYNGNDGMSLPVHVIVRPSANGSSIDYNNKKKVYGRYDDYDKLAGSSRSFKTVATGGQQKPKEKENIPLHMLQNHTTIVPLTRDGIPTYPQGGGVVDIIDSDDDGEYRGSGSNQNKKRKLDILREGGLEVTPISRRAQADLQILLPPHITTSRPNPQIMQPNVSLMSLSPVRAPPVIQSPNMYQSTTQVFKNPKEDVINAARSAKSYCLDLTSKKQHQQQEAADMSRGSRKSQLSIEEVQRNYRGSNPDLQITLVKPHQEMPSSSSSGYKANNGNNGHNQHKYKPTMPTKKLKNVPSQSAPSVPPLNSALIAAANEIQKLQKQQQNNMSLFPFFNGLDITPLQQSSSSKNSSPPAPQMDPGLMNYLSALYGNPLLPEFLKLCSGTSNNRIPSSKN